ncbi:MAG: TonB-dependent receptor [Marinilabiliales bacterium]|nr:TonB-dependent receptor [Marinilabiliales bacterium]
MDGAEALSLKREHDVSLSYGSSLLEDMAWLFANVRYRTQGYRAPYRYWTDPAGGRNFVFDFADRDLSGLFKMQMNVLDKFKAVLEFNLSKVTQPVYEADVDPLRPESSTRALDGERVMRLRFGGSYNVNQGTRIDLGVGYAKYRQPLLLSDLGVSKPEYYDVVSGRRWGSGSVNDREAASRMRAGASLTRYQDGFLGLFHELVIGGDYETTYTTSESWKADNLIYNYAAGSPYTYGLTTSPVSEEEVGWGLVGFYIAPAVENNMTVKRELKRIGVHVQDTMKIGGRISLSGGLRFDRSDARFAGVSKGSSGNSVSTAVVGSLIDQLMGYNLFSSVSLGAWEKAIVWNTLSPRAGLAVDLFGNGRTVLKGTWARLPEYLGLGYSQDLAPDRSPGLPRFPLVRRGRRRPRRHLRHLLARVVRLPRLQERVLPAGRRSRSHRPRHHRVDGRPRTAGRPRLHPLRPLHRAAPRQRYRARRLRPLDRGPLVAARRLAGRLVGPLRHRRAGHRRLRGRPGDRLPPVEHRPGFLRARRERPRAHGEIPQRRVHLPQEDVAQLAALRHPGLEPGHGDDHHGLPLERRQFPGPADAERLHQHLRRRRPPPGPAARRFASRGRSTSAAASSPASCSRPRAARPGPGRVTVLPPAAWAAANGAQTAPVTVYLESPGSRRHDGWKNLDLRLEKEFAKAGRVPVALSVDVFNLLGDKYRTLDLNDGGTWAPDGEGGSTGTRVLSDLYNTYRPLWGTRVVRLNLSLRF